MTKTRPREAGNLPGELTSFVGRRLAADEVKRALSAARLVTLTGVGGVGKSRLAVHVAYELRRAFPDGIWLVELAAVHDPALVPRAAAAALGLLETAAREPEASLADYLAGSAALIVLDNCEHVLDGAARLVSTVLPASSRLRVLATSRAPLGVGAERVWMVPPLSVPGGPGTAAGQQQAAMRRSCSSRSEPPRSCPGSGSVRTIRTRWCGYAVAWTAFRWRSSWPLSGCVCSRLSRSLTGSRTASSCSRAGSGTVRPGTRHCRPPSSGASTCARSPSASSGPAARCLPANSIWTLPRPYALGTVWMPGTCWRGRAARRSVSAGTRDRCGRPGQVPDAGNHPPVRRGAAGQRGSDRSLATPPSRLLPAAGRAGDARLLRPASGPVGQAAAGRPGEPLGGA